MTQNQRGRLGFVLTKPRVRFSEVLSQLEDLASHNFTVSCAVHPATYLNKILLGSREGAVSIGVCPNSTGLCPSRRHCVCVSVMAGPLQLWNLRTRKLVHTFAGFGSGVACLAQSPAVDVVAAGLQDGKIVLHHLHSDVSLMTFVQDGGMVTALDFRTGAPYFMAEGGREGKVRLA